MFLFDLFLLFNMIYIFNFYRLFIIYFILRSMLLFGNIFIRYLQGLFLGLLIFKLFFLKIFVLFCSVCFFLFWLIIVILIVGAFLYFFLYLFKHLVNHFFVRRWLIYRLMITVILILGFYLVSNPKCIFDYFVLSKLLRQ